MRVHFVFDVYFTSYFAGNLAEFIMWMYVWQKGVGHVCLYIRLDIEIASRTRVITRGLGKNVHDNVDDCVHSLNWPFSAFIRFRLFVQRSNYTFFFFSCNKHRHAAVGSESSWSSVIINNWGFRGIPWRFSRWKSSVATLAALLCTSRDFLYLNSVNDNWIGLCKMDNQAQLVDFMFDNKIRPKTWRGEIKSPLRSISIWFYPSFIISIKIHQLPRNIKFI